MHDDYDTGLMKTDLEILDLSGWLGLKLIWYILSWSHNKNTVMATIHNLKTSGNFIL